MMIIELLPMKVPPMTLALALELFGAALSIAGAELISRNGNLSPWGWMCFLVANVAMVIFAYISGHYGLMAMQFWFMRTSYRGVKNFLVPFLANRKRGAEVNI